MLLVALLFCCLANDFQASGSPDFVSTNFSQVFIPDAHDDGIVLRNGDIGCGFSQVRLCNECQETNVFFSVYMLGTEGMSASVGSAGTGLIGSRLGHVIWTANRGRPVSFNASLRFEPSGNLVLRDSDGRTAWESNTSTLHAVRLELQKSGNLVMLDAAGAVVWETFKTPTDSLAFYQSLGVGGRLTSSVSDRNMSEGRFYLEVELHQVSLRHRSGAQYGKWCSSPQNISFIRLENATLRCYDSNNAELDKEIALPVVDNFFLNNQFLQLLPDGDLRAYQSLGDVTSETGISIARDFIQQGTPCGEKPAACGPYGICIKGDCSCPENYFAPVDPDDLRQGCKLNQPVDGCGGNQTLVEFQGMGTLLALKSDESWPLLLDECKALCLKNCSCMGLVYSSYNSAKRNCFHMSEVLTLWNATSFLSRPNMYTFTSATFLKMSSDAKVEAKVHRPVQIPRKNNRWSTVLIVLAIVLAAGIVLLLALWRFYTTQQTVRVGKKKPLKEKASGVPASPNSPQCFDHDELCQVTNNFKNKLGEGGSSTVFAGELVDGTKVAVKRFESTRQGLKQFEAEVKTIGSIHHRNLVTLHGYGAEDGTYYLVYEFVENLSLDLWLFNKPASDSFPEKNGRFLKWQQRCRIALDIAQGLHYLHGGCSEKVLHLDIKPQNILLDESFRAKICDFGLARLVEAEQSYVNTRMRGTPGYMAPEWLHSRVTEKTDVYSFGIVLLELLSGKKTVPAQASLSSQPAMIRTAVFEQLETLVQNVDPNLGFVQGSLELKQAEKVSEIGVLCVQADPSKRPSMGNVVKMLEDVFDENARVEH